jgi:hypothetical protein
MARVPVGSHGVEPLTTSFGISMTQVLLRPVADWVDIAAQLKRVSGFSRIAGV